MVLEMTYTELKKILHNDPGVVLRSPDVQGYDGTASVPVLWICFEDKATYLSSHS